MGILNDFSQVDKVFIVRCLKQFLKVRARTEGHKMRECQLPDALWEDRREFGSDFCHSGGFGTVLQSITIVHERFLRAKSRTFEDFSRTSNC